MKRNILYVFQEITPYLPESQMSKKGRYLPQKNQEMDNQIRVFMPRYGLVKERRNQLHEVIRLSGMNIVVNDMDHSLVIKVASIQAARMQVYFIDNEDYFQRKALFRDEEGKFFEDNDERTIFFARGVLETIKKLRWTPDLVHINGWLTSLIPLYLRKAYKEDPIFQDSKVILSIYDDEFVEEFDANIKKKIKLHGVTDRDLKVFEKNDYLNIMKLAIKNSDGIIMASSNINPELEEYAKKNKKPILEYQGEEEYFEAYNKFYDKILSLKKKT
ncbi:MAG: glycogen/starch synthase [Bacteroidota bacterium]|nr:glycogen/starch synthase [Bacteroidota bacterium]